MNHHPELYRAGRWGSWAHCCCGWQSHWSYTTVTGAHLAFGKHLLEATRGASGSMYQPGPP